MMAQRSWGGINGLGFNGGRWCASYFTTRSNYQRAVGKHYSQVKIDTHLISETAAPKAPGMKYKHYSPDAEVWIISGQTAEWQAAIQQAKEQQEKIGLFLSDEQAAQLDTENAFVYSYGAETVENATKELFAGLRALDQQGATTIFARICRNWFRHCLHESLEKISQSKIF